MANDYSGHDEETLLEEYNKLLDGVSDPVHQQTCTAGEIIGERYKLRDMHSEIVNRGLTV